jgi:hypothetical protein
LFISLFITADSFAAPAPVYKDFDQALSQFSGDLKSKRVVGLDDMAIRSVTIAKVIPEDLKSRVEALISQQILEVARTRLVHCIICKKMQEPGNTTTPAQLKRMALQNRIRNFMDVTVNVGVPGNAKDHHLHLIFKIVSVKTDATVWEKDYQSP